MHVLAFSCIPPPRGKLSDYEPCALPVLIKQFPPNHDFFHASHQHHKRSELSTWEWKGQFTLEMTHGSSDLLEYNQLSVFILYDYSTMKDQGYSREIFSLLKGTYKQTHEKIWTQGSDIEQTSLLQKMLVSFSNSSREFR